jgi:hypothetical protein
VARVLAQRRKAAHSASQACAALSDTLRRAPSGASEKTEQLPPVAVAWRRLRQAGGPGVSIVHAVRFD